MDIRKTECLPKHLSHTLVDSHPFKSLRREKKIKTFFFALSLWILLKWIRPITEIEEDEDERKKKLS